MLKVNDLTKTAAVSEAKKGVSLRNETLFEGLKWVLGTLAIEGIVYSAAIWVVYLLA